MSTPKPPAPPQALAPTPTPVQNAPGNPHAQAQPKKLSPLPQTVEALRELMVLGSDNPSMPEAIFPNFLRALYDPKTDKFNIPLWFMHFGTYRKGIDITDAAGKVLFVCPPVMATLKTRLGRNEGILLSDVSSEAALQGRRHHMLEKRTLDQGIADYKPQVAYDVRAAWKEILIKYEILPKEQTATKTLTPESLLSLDGDDL
jgi:hypothetical protein